MHRPVDLACPCGALTGSLDLAGAGPRVVCHCDDCQAYARWLGRPDTLDAHGGTEVVQTWPARVQFAAGAPLALLRLSPKGLFRWYAGCCRAPVANSLGPRVPFTGVVRARLVVDAPTLEAALGRAEGVQGRFAPGGCPPGVSPRASIGVMATAGGALLRGLWAGGHQPSPFFDADGQPRASATVLDPAARAALTD